MTKEAGNARLETIEWIHAPSLTVGLLTPLVARLAFVGNKHLL